MKLIDIIKDAKIIGIVREDDPKKALEIASAYIEAGLKIIEINAPVEVTKTLPKKTNTRIMQGGIITKERLNGALDAGADLLSSPIYQPTLSKLAICRKTPLIPSVTTPSEAYLCWKERIPIVKLYPISALGGTRYLSDIIKPMPFLNLIPCGFVKIKDIKEYLELGAVAVGIGREFYKNKTYAEIVEIAKETLESIN